MTSQMTPENEKDIVHLHVLPRQTAADVVNVSPFAVKLEIWFRINNIKFQVTKNLITEISNEQSIDHRTTLVSNVI